MTEGRLETESRCRECLAIIKGEVTSNNLALRKFLCKKESKQIRK